MSSLSPDSSSGQIDLSEHSNETLVMQYILRGHRPGDIGWVVQRHGELYSKEYGWDERFEAIVAGITARFIENFDPQRERCWIAECDGKRLGCVFLVKDSSAVARLRMLLVEPEARGMGLGKRLVDECVSFARQAGYSKVTLWTEDVLTAARNIYESAGFMKVKEEPHSKFGYPTVSETWELKL
jgi:GNAT superfamily N-acetyltransferase